MCGHCPDMMANLADNGCCPRILWIKHTDSVHEFLDSDRRMVDLSRVDEEIKNVGRPTLHLVYVDTCVEQQRLPADQVFAHEWKLVI